ncbi:MAG: hypothetical protein AAF846_02760 [Chloroflexota bacterium]
MWLGLVIFGIVIALAVALLNQHGETYDRLHKKHHDAHNAMHHRDIERHRRK